MDSQWTNLMDLRVPCQKTTIHSIIWQSFSSSSPLMFKCQHGDASHSIASLRRFLPNEIKRTNLLTDGSIFASNVVDHDCGHYNGDNVNEACC